MDVNIKVILLGVLRLYKSTIFFVFLFITDEKQKGYCY